MEMPVQSFLPRPDVSEIDDRLPVQERYRILGRIATGAMGQVFLARLRCRDGSWKDVVLKRIRPELQIDPQMVEMFHDEARIASKLAHPNIVRIFELGEIDGSMFIAMELVEGLTLSALGRRLAVGGKLLPLEAVLRIGCDVLAALDHAHRLVDVNGRPLNIVHRDVSPPNILVSFGGAVKLLDFGVTKAEGRLHHTRPGLLKGKLAYMAPEQIRGDAVDARTDLFALGALLYEALLGTHPFFGKTDAMILRSIVDSEPLPPARVEPGFPAMLAAILLKALAKDPRARYPSAAAMLRDVEGFLRTRASNVGAGHLAALMEEHCADRLRDIEHARRHGDDRLLVAALQGRSGTHSGVRVSLAAPPSRLPLIEPDLARAAQRAAQRGREAPSALATRDSPWEARTEPPWEPGSEEVVTHLELPSLLPVPAVSVMTPPPANVVRAAPGGGVDTPSPNVTPRNVEVLTTSDLAPPAQDFILEPHIEVLDDGVVTAVPPDEAQVGRYRLLELVRSTRSADVFAASFEGPLGYEKRVALRRLRRDKVAEPTEVELFARELRQSARWSHPNLVQVFDFNAGEDVFAVEEYVDGWNLEALIDRCRATRTELPFVLVCRIGAELASGLAHLHAQNAEREEEALIHRDVAPHQVLLSRAGAVKLTGFELVRAVGGSFPEPAGAWRRTDYAPPERLTPVAGPEREATDFYLLGLLLDECLTLDRLFERDTPEAQRSAILAGAQTSLEDRRPGLPARLVELVDRCLARAPKARPSSALEIALNLEQVLIEAGVPCTAHDLALTLHELYQS